MMSATEAKQTHTPGALRAAQAISQMGRYPVNKLDLAELISRETGDLEMLAALELLLSEMINGQDSPSLRAMQQVYAAIHKAKGEQP